MLHAPRRSGLLLIGRRLLRSNNSWLHNSERLTKGKPACTLLMHPQDAAARGIAAGAQVNVRSAAGHVTAAAELSDEMKRGVVSLPHGYGHARPDVVLRVANSRPGASLNDLTLGSSVFVSAGDAASGKVPIFAHASLVAQYAQENGLISELQSVRSMHMFGASLGPADRKDSNNGIGPFLGRGPTGFIPPNRTFDDQLEITVAGVHMQLVYVPSEADSEIAVYLPDDRVLLSAEVVQDHTFPNVYTIRGARYRDPVRSVASIDRLREFASDEMVLQHGPPVHGEAEVARVLTLYRDQIQFVRALKSGDAQFAAELASLLVHARTDDMQARHLQAAAFRKLGYAQISANWRNYYLVSAMELDGQLPGAA